MDTLSVHLLQGIESGELPRFREALAENVELTSGDELSSPAQFEVLIAGVPQREHLTANPNLQTLIIPWSGLPVKTRELLLDFPGISVYNIHHNAAPAAETAMTLLLVVTKDILSVDRKFRKNDWTPRYADPTATLLAGKTAVVLGYGAIGRLVAKACYAFGMHVRATRKRITRPEGRIVLVHPAGDMRKLLPQANVLFITLPATPETNNLIGKDELALLPDGAAIINIARGAIIDEAALYAELSSGRLRAGLDVWYNYPQLEPERENTPPASKPFHSLPNVVMTPHLAGHSDDTEARRITELAELLNAAAAGQAMPNRVDVKRGY